MQHTAMTGNRAPGLFQQDLDQGAEELYQRVINADYAEATTLVKANPCLMFLPVKGGNTPLKEAFRRCDTYMWRIFENAVKDNPEFMSEFEKQLMEQNNHIDLRPLFEAYAAYDVQYQRCFRDEITDAELDNAWFKLALVQYECLVQRDGQHILREFCRDDDRGCWTNKSDFNDPAYPTGSAAYNFDNHQPVSLLPGSPFGSRFGLASLSGSSDSGFGSRFGLVRGLMAHVFYCGPGLLFPAQVCADAVIFRHYFEKRLAELNQRRAQITQRINDEANTSSPSQVRVSFGNTTEAK